MKTTMTSDIPVGRLAAEHPLATRVFARHQIDYCCGGGRPLATPLQPRLNFSRGAVIRFLFTALAEQIRFLSLSPEYGK